MGVASAPDRQATAPGSPIRRRGWPKQGLGPLTVCLAAGIFAVDVLTPLEGAVAVLYTVVVLLAARAFGPRGVVLMAANCMVLTAAAYGISHGHAPLGSPLIRCLVSLVAVGVTTTLALQNQRTTTVLAEQAGLLELTHDAIFVRDARQVITFWNRAAEELYGWHRAEALGRNVHELLRPVFPAGRQAATAELMRTGRWQGELVHTKRSGATVIVESNWAVRHNGGGLQAVLETNTDITARKAAHVALVESERRYRTIFDTTRVSILQQDWTQVKTALDALECTDARNLEDYLARHPAFVRQLRRSVRIVDVNAVTLRMLAASDKEPVVLQSLDDLLPEGEPAFTTALLALAQGAPFYEGETRLRKLTGEALPVLLGITFPSAADGFARVLVFAVDITERKQAEAALLAVQAELAHAARKATLGELTASIAHEVNQPLAAVVTNGEAALRWLRRDVPDLDEASAALTRAVASGRQAGAIVARTRAFLAKVPPPREGIALDGMIAEAALLIGHEMSQNGVILKQEVEPNLPAVLGDRVQLQQVMINLMVNGIQAMSAIQDHPRVLRIRALRECGGDRESAVLVEVADSGEGFATEDEYRLFTPFFTTKADGMGLGLSICRSTIEAHGGRVWACSHEGPGAAFRFTLPILSDARTS